MQSLLFVGAEWDRQARVRATFRAGSIGAERRAGCFFGGEAEAGGEEEQGEVLHGIDITAGQRRSFVYRYRA
jgi:hypothetical protein